MNFYTMKMKEGSDGNQTSQEIKEFIQKYKIVGIGDPAYTTGDGSFLNMQIGDIIVLRQPFALLKVVSEPMQYQANAECPNFDWLYYYRKIEILSWYDEDKNKYNIPDFDARGYLATFQQVESTDKRNVCETWLKIIQNH